MTTTHAQRFKIIGYCDATWKWAGTWQCTHFAEADCFEADHLPTLQELREYATKIGLWPSNKPGSSLDICKPIYHGIGDGFDYLQCRQCFSGEPMIDNRVGPQ